MSNFSLISDQPLFFDDKKLDGLGFVDYSEILSSAAYGTDGPFTFGIYGEWGTGKTSLLKFIEKKLETKYGDDVICIWFNAWKFEREDHPIIPLLGVINQKIEENKSFLKNNINLRKDFQNALRAIASGLTLAAKLNIPNFGGVEAKYSGKDFNSQLDQLEKEGKPIDNLLEKSLYFDAFSNLDKLQIPKKKKVIVLIDDLDRCFPESALKLLEGIKLILSQPNFIFFIGVAKKILEDFLEKKYKEDFGSEAFIGQAYLDKIIQLPFQIPPHEARVKDFCSILTKDMSISNKNLFDSILPIVSVALKSNPRSTIRFANNLIIDNEINKNINSSSVSIEVLAISRALQQKKEWISIFRSLHNDQLLCELLVTNIDSIFNDGVEEKMIKEIKYEIKVDIFKKILKKLREDNNLYDLLLSNPGIEWLKKEDERKSAIHYFKYKRNESVFRSNDKKDVTIFLSKKNINERNIIVNSFLSQELNYDIFFIEEVETSINKIDGETYLLFLITRDNLKLLSEQTLLNINLRKTIVIGLGLTHKEEDIILSKDFLSFSSLSNEGSSLEDELDDVVSLIVLDQLNNANT